MLYQFIGFLKQNYQNVYESAIAEPKQIFQKFKLFQKAEVIYFPEWDLILMQMHFHFFAKIELFHGIDHYVLNMYII